MTKAESWVRMKARKLGKGANWWSAADLEQEGHLAVAQARHRFDPTKASWETFAATRAVGGMMDALRQTAWPRVLRAIRKRIAQATWDVRHRVHREPYESEIAQELRVSRATLARWRKRITDLEEWHTVVGREWYPQGPENPEQAYRKQELADLVRLALSQLPPREALLLRRYYWDDATHPQAARTLGISPIRARQLRARALERMRSLCAGLR